ncbi:TetR/AcrR family transcriptional regulator [Marinobacter persicus]|jgi:AcrR family transcriptional regulator|uniref:TetR family transcriptional regulator n=1 Tax=Marinobacter persicus TaxID=930118 RepID=A0A2S6GA79_9GAMM|nr:TetR/AcrR family transcriptional regulator [Marinobacter persicus]KXS52855.1 MAG: TetR family transcriptional regulator [Marinobacter sp. T13-3]PPK53360.1 TetR family transcriptional regulator [Marinobacter persicus]PPK56197.1 TetR family transcriptional regulator [Marinobacter persicus]PPK59792.1 TetR family transcriptional regulator [Marinobacter persicus]
MARHPQYNRDAALHKAVGLFWEKGYHGSSMKQIEQTLDMRPGSIYAAFGSKDGLFSEALARYAEQGGEELSGHMQQYDSIVDGLQAYLRHVAMSCQQDACPSRACMIVKTLLETSHTNDTLANQAREVLAAIESTLASLLEQAQSRGELVPGTDCNRLARLLQSQIMGLRAMAERGLSEQQLAELADDMANLLEPHRTKH